MMTTRATTASAATALILGWMGFATMNDEPQVKPNAYPPSPRRVAVRLLGPAMEITGIAVPAHILAGKRPRFFQIGDPSLITVDLPDGKKISLPVKTAFVNTEIDVRTKTAVVVDVELLPLPKSVPYREAVVELRKLMHAMGVEPDERMRKQMAGWPDDLLKHTPDFDPVPPSPTHSAGMELDETVSLGTVVRPAADGGFYLVLTFAASVDATRPLWDPNFRPTIKPPAEAKSKEQDSDSGKK